MRLYDAATIKEERLTGFQSPCSEFADKPLSFDERYELGNPGLRLLTVEADFPKLQIFKGDQVLVDLAKRPGKNSLIVTIMDDEVKLFQGIPEGTENFDGLVCGVVTVIIRKFF